MLEYALEPNELTDGTSDFCARVVNVQSYSQQDIADRIMKIGAGLTRSDIASVLEAEKQVIKDIIAEGGAVHTELFHTFPSIQGVFNSAEDSFEPSRHRVRTNLQPGTALRDVTEAVKTKRVAGHQTGAVISAITDVKSGSVNHILTRGRNVKVSGAKLKIVGDDPAIGFFFVPENGNPVRLDSSDLVVNNPSELIAVIPNLPDGTYFVRIVTQYSGGGLLKTPHILTDTHPLTIS